jgi:hypothetical protein
MKLIFLNEKYWIFPKNITYLSSVIVMTCDISLYHIKQNFIQFGPDIDLQFDTKICHATLWNIQKTFIYNNVSYSVVWLIILLNTSVHV